MIEGITKAFKEYGNPDAKFLFVISGEENNIFD